MVLNELGVIASNYYLEIPKHFPNVELDISQIMPNHIHGIIRIIDEENNRINCRDAIHRVQDNKNNHNIDINNNQLENNITDPNQDAMNRVPTDPDQGGFAGSKSPMLNKNSLSNIIHWFKGRTTFEAHKANHDIQWQPRFYEHIIRNQKSYNEVYNYIQSNPQMWDRDRNNLKI